MSSFMIARDWEAQRYLHEYVNSSYSNKDLSPLDCVNMKSGGVMTRPKILV